MTGQEPKGLTIGGTRLEEALSTIHSAEKAANGEKFVAIYMVADKDGGEVGAARITEKGWSMSGGLTLAVKQGKLDPGLRVAFKKRIT